ncbi:MAG: peptide deformylase, partial [Deltaproteobacteria bacterium]
MAILKIARMGHPVLLQKAEPVADMIETMEDAQGAGLAAPQVHVPLRLFVFRVPPGRTQPAEGDGEMGNTVVINPTLELLGEEMVLRW